MFKRAIRAITPPVLLSAAKAVFGRQPDRPEYEYLPEGWQAQETDTEVKGWDVPFILEAHQAGWAAWAERMAGTGPLSESLWEHNTLLVYAYGLARAAHQRSALKLLDWGGGIGQYYLLSRALLPNLALTYHCVELPEVAAHGQVLFPEAHFLATGSPLATDYDFVLASGAVHYAPDWRGVLTTLTRACNDWLLASRVPTTEDTPAYVFKQRTHKYGEPNSYLSWCLNRDECLAHLTAAGFTLVREFLTGEAPDIAGAPAPCRFRGFLLRRT